MAAGIRQLVPGEDPSMLGRFWVLILIALSRYASEALSWFPDGSGRCGIS